jgi:hypothetical protein
MTAAARIPAPLPGTEGHGVITSTRVSEAFASELLRDVIACLGLKANTPPEAMQRRLAALTDALAAFQARSEIEAMTAAQIVALHYSGMAALKASAHPDLPHEIASRLRRDAARLFACASELTDSVERRRSGGGSHQVVRVEHVTVEAGAQAVIGAVLSRDHRGGP